MARRRRQVRCLGLVVVALCLSPVIGEAQTGASRVYVRRIEFQGAERIDDDVLRRELLQLEGTYLNGVAVEQSRLRLERLSYIESARAFVRPIEGAPDQVDVVFAITMAPARRYGGGGGYSEAQRTSVHGYFINENVLGTGQRFSATARVSEFRSFAEISHTNPYLNSDRVSRAVALSSRQIDQLTADTTELAADLATARLEYSYPTGTRQALRLGIALHSVELATSPVESDQLLEWVQRNGNPAMGGTVASTSFWTAELLLGWRQDTRNRPVFPDRGLEQSATLRWAVPGSEAEYYAFDYELTKYWPLTGRWSVRLDANLGFGKAYGSATSSLPPYLNWFAGGPDSVRGYRESRLGPRDSLGNPYGGNLFVSGQFELLLPVPESWREHTRIGLFYDIGNVFSTENVSFPDDAGQPTDYDFELSQLRQSVGVSARILIPLGVLRLSYGIPIDAEDDHPNRFLRDDIERFQIGIGVQF